MAAMKDKIDAKKDAAEKKKYGAKAFAKTEKAEQKSGKEVPFGKAMPKKKGK